MLTAPVKSRIPLDLCPNCGYVQCPAGSLHLEECPLHDPDTCLACANMIEDAALPPLFQREHPVRES